jgi:hypothetical protein
LSHSCGDTHRISLAKEVGLGLWRPRPAASSSHRRLRGRQRGLQRGLLLRHRQQLRFQPQLQLQHPLLTRQLLASCRARAGRLPSSAPAAGVTATTALLRCVPGAAARLAASGCVRLKVDFMVRYVLAFLRASERLKRDEAGRTGLPRRPKGLAARAGSRALGRSSPGQTARPLQMNCV